MRCGTMSGWLARDCASIFQFTRERREPRELANIGGIKSGESGIKSGEPGMKSGKPGIKSGEPGIKSGKPGMKSGKPGIKSRAQPRCYHLTSFTGP